ncbi:MAG: S8 family serine peptidase, partial [Pseudomonadales bacterium]
MGFLNATAAGVYVSASSGNSGPGPATVAHLGPWVATTAASTHDRTIPNSVVDLGSDGAATADITGLGLTSGYGPAPIVYAGDFPTANGSQNDGNPAQCLDPFPAGHFSGEIVVCDRGAIARVAKGANVLAGGAGGFVLANVDAQGESIVGDAHFLPGVHIGDSDGDVLRAWLDANTGTTASITGFSVVENASDGDIMASFSSRGPNNAFGVLKPDVTAPGVSIFAAAANGGALLAPEYQFLSGTSMSSPHNAGAGALMSAVQPDWTPYQIRSALMMTAERDSTLKEDGSTPTDHFDLGAGRIDLSRAQEAGLVLDETPANFLAADPATGGDPTNLNLASMQDNVCVGTCSWTRTVENVTGHGAHWKVSTYATGGLELSADPNRKLKLKKRKSGEITVTADTTLAAPGWNFGTLELERKGKGPDLHMPIAVFAANSSNSDLLNKTVDAATAAEDEPLNYEITITNGQVDGQINLTDVLPEGLNFVPGSESEVVINGTTISPFSHGGGTLTWSGTLDTGVLDVIASPAPFGYFSLGAFGVPPFSLPGNCDDGAFIINIPAFTYNGQSYSQVIWSVNGTLEAGIDSLLASSFLNQNLPDPTPPNNLLAPFWRDLNLCAGGNWYVAVLGAGPFTWAIFEWEDVPHFGSPDAATFQVWIEIDGSPTAPAISYTYARLDNVNVGATVGAEDASG